MTVTVVYQDINSDGYTRADSSSWATARDATTATFAWDYQKESRIAAYLSGGMYYVQQAYLSFDVSMITGSISSTVFSTNMLNVSAGDTYGFTARVFDWGTTLELTDHSSRTELLAMTEIATLAWQSTTGLKNWTSTSSMNSFVENANIARFVVAHTRQTLDVVPTTIVSQSISTYETTGSRSYLTITWTPPEALTTTTIYEDVNGGWIESYGTSWAAARDGTGSLTTANDNATSRVNANYSSPNYFVEESFFGFDCSSIPDSDIVSAVSCNVYIASYVGTPQSGTKCVMYDYDWGTTLDTTDFRTQTQLSSMTELGAVANPTAGSAWMTINGNNSLLTHANIKSGVVRVVLTSDCPEDNITPSANAYYNIYRVEHVTNVPYLTVTHAATVTAVSQLSAAQWDVDALASRATAAQWDVDALASRLVAGVWDVDALSGVQAVSALWDVTGLTGIRDTSGLWNVDMLTGVQPTEALWDLEGKVFGDFAAEWNTDGRVGADSSALWDLDAYLVDELAAEWDVTIGTGAGSVEAVWDVEGKVGADVEAQWDLDGRVSEAVAAEWDVMHYTAPAPVVTRWDVLIDIPADNTMTYYFMDAVTGDLLGDLPFMDVSMSWVLSGSGSFEGTLKLSDPEVVSRGGRNIVPGRTVLVADRGGVPIWSGIVWSKQFTGADATLRISAGDFWSYIKRRMVFTNYSETSTDVLWAAENLIKMAVDPGVFAPHLLTYQLSKPVTVADRPIKLTYAITDMKNIGEAIEELAESAGTTGIDFICKQYWAAEEVLIPFIKIGRPYVGRLYEETLTEFSFPGNVISYEETIDASAMANRLIAKGTDNGSKTPYTIITRDHVLDEYPRYDFGVSVDNTNLSVVESQGTYAAARRATATRVASFVVRADIDPSPLDMEIGDWFHLLIEDAQSSIPQERAYRLGGMTYNPADQTVEIIPWVETDEYE